VKDLVDLILLIEAGLLTPERLGARLHHVYAMRDKSLPPCELPPPPASWTRPYAAMATDLGLAAASTDHAYRSLTAEYRRVLLSTDGVTRLPQTP
jgi:hypothetical protein